MNRRLDNHHDWTFGQGKNNYTSRSEAIAQRVKCRLWSFINDWHLNMNFGLPWFQTMAQKNSIQDVVLMVKNQVLNTEGVKEVKEIIPTFDSEARKLIISIIYIDIYGTQNTVYSAN